MDSWDHMYKFPKDNWPWPKDNILLWNYDTFCSCWASSCTNYLQRANHWFPKLAPFVGLGWTSRKKLCHSLPLQQQAPFPSVTNTPWECQGGRQGTTKAAQLGVLTAAPLLVCKGKQSQTWPLMQKQWHWQWNRLLCLFCGWNEEWANGCEHRNETMEQRASYNLLEAIQALK